MGASDDHVVPCKGDLWNDEFAAFANMKPKQSTSTTSNVPATVDALKAVASKGQIMHIETIPPR